MRTAGLRTGAPHDEQVLAADEAHCNENEKKKKKQNTCIRSG
jgi:hypothetical protein